MRNNINRSRFPRYLDHLRATSRRVAYGLAVPQCKQSDFFWRLARPSHLKHPPISAFPRIDAAAFEPSRQPFLVAELEKRASVNQLKVPRMPVIEIAEDKTSIDVLGHRQAHNAANSEL